MFAALEQRRVDKITREPPSAAVFKFKFSDSRKERRVEIIPPAIARYERNEDSEAVEHWLRERGFMVTPAREGTEDATDRPVLEST